MKWTLFMVSVVTAFCALDTTPVVANDLADVVRARGNARAGGGTSGHDAWVLKRHGRLSGSRTSRKPSSAKKRAYLAAKKKKAAAAKRRAYLAAKKKKEAERRAYIAAKKKKAAEKRAKLAAQRKAEEQRLARAKREADAKAEQQKLANVETNKAAANPVETEKTESAFVSAPSTAVLMTSQELVREQDAGARKPLPGNIARAEPAVKSAPVATDSVGVKNTTAGSSQATDGEDGCKRFLPAIGLTISVGC